MPVHRTHSVSVGKRLAALVAVQAATAAMLLAVAFAGYWRLVSDLGFMRRYVLAPIEGISEAMENAAQLKLAAEAAPKSPPDPALMQHWKRDVGLFLERYRTEWAVAENRSEDALHFQADLERANQRELVTNERSAMYDMESSLERIDAGLSASGTDGQIAASIVNDARDLRTALRKLLRVSVGFIEVENAAIERRNRQTEWWMSAPRSWASPNSRSRVRRALTSVRVHSHS